MISRGWGKESGLLHHQHDKLLGARINLLLILWISTDLCPSLYPCTHLASTNLINLSHLRTAIHWKSGVFRPRPQERTVFLHISDPSRTFFKILWEVTPCWELNLNVEQLSGWMVTQGLLPLRKPHWFTEILLLGGKLIRPYVASHGLREGGGASFFW